MQAEKEPDPADQAASNEETPTDPELDVDGPNESAPGHEPQPEGVDEHTTREGS